MSAAFLCHQHSSFFLYRLYLSLSSVGGLYVLSSTFFCCRQLHVPLTVYLFSGSLLLLQTVFFSCWQPSYVGFYVMLAVISICWQPSSFFCLQHSPSIGSLLLLWHSSLSAPFFYCRQLSPSAGSLLVLSASFPYCRLHSHTVDIRFLLSAAYFFFHQHFFCRLPSPFVGSLYLLATFMFCYQPSSSVSSFAFCWQPTIPVSSLFFCRYPSPYARSLFYRQPSPSVSSLVLLLFT